MRRQDMETISVLVALREGNPPVMVAKGPVMQTFDVSFVVSLHTLLNK